MKRFMLLVAVLAGVPCSAAMADMREMGQNELRASVQSGVAIGLSEAWAMTKARLDGDLVDVRAFADDKIYYRIVAKRPDGQLVAVIIDARVGRFLSSKSSKAKEVMAASKNAAAASDGDLTGTQAGGGTSNSAAGVIGGGSPADTHNSGGTGRGGSSGGGSSGGGSSGGGNSGGGNSGDRGRP